MNFKFPANFKKFMIAALLFYIAILLLLFLFQRKLQYVPNGQITDIPHGFSQEILTAADGVKIFSIFKKPQKNHKIIVYFHGNAGNLSDRFQKFETFANSGFGIMAISYRGYSKSQGFPNEENLIADGKMALEFLFNLGYKQQDLILFGESLGSGIAMQLAAQFNVAAVILESPYASIVDVAQRRYWFVPVSLLLKDKFESIKFAQKISSKVLIIHGTADQVVPFSQGQKLFTAIQSLKKFIAVDGADHLGFSNEFLLQEIEKFL